MRRLLIDGLLALLPGAVLCAQPLDWSSLSYDCVAQGESLRDVLASFGTNYDASVIVSDKANDQVSGRSDLESPQAFLQLMVSLHDPGWYYDGTVLYIFKTTKTQSWLVRLEQVGEAELKRALTAAGIWEPHFGWRADPSGRLVHVSDPERYLEPVERTAQVPEQQYILRSEKAGDPSVEIFSLRYAIAEDRKIEYRDDEIEAPGIASTLSRMFGDANVVTVGDESGRLRPGPRSSHAAVQAEPSLNVVVVRNHKDRLSMHRHPIEVLDRPSAWIEVDLSIININAENLAQLGVDWSAGIRLDNNKSIQIRTTDQDSEEGGGAGNGVVGSLVDSRGLGFLLAKVTLLQSQGQVQIGSRPTLLIQENTQVILGQSETYYVRVAGERVAELKVITYGAMLKMMLRVVTLGDTPEVSLSLHIEDGSQKPSSAGLDKIPTINCTVIDTIARVGHGQNLLIGGIYCDELSQSRRKVPWLDDIPHLGVLLRITADTVRRSAWLSLTEPRLTNDGVGHYLTLNNRRDLRGGPLEIDELSNQSLSLREPLDSACCQALAPARAERERSRRAGQGSFLTLCRMGMQEGWRMIDGVCPKDGTWCVGAERGNQHGLEDPLLQRAEPGRRSLARRGPGGAW